MNFENFQVINSSKDKPTKIETPPEPNIEQEAPAERKGPPKAPPPEKKFKLSSR